MLPGRSPKPTSLRVLEGNPQHRPMPKNEPKPRLITPIVPAHLDAFAREHWDALVGELELVPGLLTVVDGGALSLLCQAWSEWRSADAAIQEHGLTVENKQGMFARPEVRIRDTAAKRYRALASEFGLTPSSRSRINVGSGQEAVDDGILS